MSIFTLRPCFEYIDTSRYFISATQLNVSVPSSMEGIVSLSSRPLTIRLDFCTLNLRSYIGFTVFITISEHTLKPQN